MSPHRPNSHRRGFSMFEIMIVVLILSILAAIVLPLYRNYTGDAYKAHAHATEKALQDGATLYLANYKGS